MKTAVLSHVPLFAALPRSEIDQLARTLPRLAAEPGELLFREGEHGDCFYVVLTGEVEIVKALATVDERVVGVRGPGEFVGEMSLISQDERRTASVRVRAAADLLTISRSAFDALVQRQPSLAYHMARVLGARLRESDDATIRDLQEKNQRLLQAYRELEAAQAQLVEKETLERELQVAREIQESMLPQSLPHLAGFDFGAVMVAARAVGGDFFDLFPLDATRMGIVVGDVSGKGVPAALFMALTRSLLYAEATRGNSPRETLQRVNQHLLHMNAAGMFVTVLYGILDGQTGHFAYARAGHELPLLIDAAGQLHALPLSNGHPLGLLPDPAVDEQMLLIEPGGTLLVYTDGVTDALDPEGAFFGLESLCTQLSTMPRATGQAMCDALRAVLSTHQGTALQFDDVTLVALHRGQIQIGGESTP